MYTISNIINTFSRCLHMEHREIPVRRVPISCSLDSTIYTLKEETNELKEWREERKRYRKREWNTICHLLVFFLENPPKNREQILYGKHVYKFRWTISKSKTSTRKLSSGPHRRNTRALDCSFSRWTCLSLSIPRSTVTTNFYWAAYSIYKCSHLILWLSMAHNAIRKTPKKNDKSRDINNNRTWASRRNQTQK